MTMGGRFLKSTEIRMDFLLTTQLQTGAVVRGVELISWGGTEVPAALDGCVQYRGHLREG